MARLINLDDTLNRKGGRTMTREEAIEAIKMAQAQIEWDYPMDYAVAFDMAIKALEQLERFHAHWTRKRTYAHDGELYCSHCDCDAPAEYGRYTYMKTDFCPNCGAIMDEEE